jgi:SAM-dependent methyltransferase
MPDYDATNGTWNAKISLSDHVRTMRDKMGGTAPIGYIGGDMLNWRSPFRDVPITTVERFWDRRPCNVRHSQIAIDDRPLEYSRAVTRRKYKVEPHIPGFASYESWAGGRVLDAGCGIGTDTIRFAKAGAQVTAVDLSGESLKIARKRCVAETCIMDVRFYQADLERLSEVVPVESYDLIYSFGVLHHTPKPEKALQELLRYTKPGTIFKLMLYHRDSTKAWWALRKTWSKRRIWTPEERIAQFSEAQTGCPITWTFTRDQARGLMDTYDLSILDLRIDHIFPYKIPAYVEYRYEKAFPWSITPPWLFGHLQRLWGWHMQITAQYN